MFKKLFILLFAIIIFCSGCSADKKPILTENTLNKIVAKKEISIGVRTDVYPFAYYDKNGNYAGIEIELAKMIAQGILGDNYKIKFVPVTASNRIFKLYSGDIDMLVALMTVSNKRKEILDFSDSYFTAGQAILVNKGSSLKSLGGLKNRVAIIVYGSTSEMSLRGAVPGVKVIGYKTYEEAYRALKARKAEAIVADDVVLIGMHLKDPSVIVLPKRYTKESYAVAFRKGDESNDLVEAVNKVLEIQTQNGKLKQLYKNYGIK